MLKLFLRLLSILHCHDIHDFRFMSKKIGRLHSNKFAWYYFTACFLDRRSLDLLLLWKKAKVILLLCKFSWAFRHFFEVMGLKKSFSQNTDWPRIDPFFSKNTIISMGKIVLILFFQLWKDSAEKTDPKNYRGWKGPSLMPIRVNRYLLNCLIFSTNTNNLKHTTKKCHFGLVLWL